MLFGLGRRDHDSQNQYSLSLETPGYSDKFNKNLFGANLTMSEIMVCFCRKRRGPKNPDDPSNVFLKILKMGSISSRKHEMGTW